ncbi:hypothetical protein [Streptomyces phaeochromogenes]|uniref:hypothetical protein n=1 Tax=Streptomyces phaeochromogenes TaxID=1923 RepID=UPI0037208C71
MKLARVSVVFAGAMALYLTMTGTASAASGTDAGVPGAWGKIEVDWDTARRAGIELTVKDTAADGAHAEMRVASRDAQGDTVWYSWRAASGNGVTVGDSTYASVSDGLVGLRIQVCRVDKDTIEDCAYSDWVMNPYW